MSDEQGDGGASAAAAAAVAAEKEDVGARAAAGSQDDDGGAPVVMMRRAGKGSRKKKSLRRKKKKKKKKKSEDAEDEDEGEEDAARTKQLLADLMTEQKRRARRAGLGAAALVKGPKKIVAAETAVVAKPEKKKQYGLVESKQEKVKKLENLLGGTFTAMTDQEMTDDTNPFLQKYLDEHMGTKGEKEEEVDAKVLAQRSLYQIPAELQAHGKAGAAPDEDLGGAPMLHGTGIAEVSLPMEFKIKCIEDTEEARKQYLSKRRGWGDKRQRSKMLGNVTANFKQHQADFIARVKGKRPRDDRNGDDKQPQNPRGGPRHQHSSDDAAVQRFRKRMRRRF